MPPRSARRKRTHWPCVMVLAASAPNAAWAQLLAEDVIACNASRPKPVADRTVHLNGQEQTRISWPDLPAASYLVLVREMGADLSIAPNAADAPPSDSPVRRRGTQILLWANSGSSSLALHLRNKEPSGVKGTAVVSLLTLDSAAPSCIEYFREIATGDREYGAAELLSRTGTVVAGSSRSSISMRAAKAYERAEKLAMGAPAPPLAAHAQLALASVNYQGHHDWKASRDVSLRAAQSFAGLKRPYFTARAEGMAGAAMLEAGSSGDPYAEARVLLERAASAFRSTHDTYDEALQINNVGLSYLYAGQFAPCIEQSRRAISLFTQVKERHRVALAEQNIALCEWGLGNLRRASSIFERVVPILKDAPLPIHYTTALNNGALASFALGEFDRSILLHAEGERAAAQFSMPRERAQSLYGLGVTYAAIGDFDTAQDYLRQSLSLRSAELDSRGRVASLRAIASILDARGSADAANDLDRQALALRSSDLTKLKIELRILSREVTAGRTSPEFRRRIEELASGNVGDREVVARALYLRGLLAAAGDDAKAAFADFADARSRFLAIESVDGEYDVCLASARLAHRRRDFARARDAVACATTIADQMRAQVLNPELRASVGQLRRDAADLEVAIAYDDPGAPLERVQRVLAVMERHRGLLFADYVSAQTNSGAPMAGATSLSRMYDDLATARYQLEVSQTRGGTDTSRAAELRARVAEKRIAVLQAEQRLRSAGASTRFDAVDVKAVRARSPADTAVIEYWLGRERAFAVVITREDARVLELTGTKTIDAEVSEFRNALTDASGAGKERRFKQAQRLSRQVLDPLTLASGTRRIVFVLDGSLHYFPMSALCAESQRCAQMLVETMIVANAPSVTWLSTTRDVARSPASRVLIVADPVYEAGDPRIGTRPTRVAARTESSSAVQIATLRGGQPYVSTLRRLPGTAIEASRVAATFPDSPIDLFTGIAATRSRILALDLGRYDVLHFAVHGISDHELPQLSALALTQYVSAGTREDGRLWAGDLLRKRLNARLVFLSACDTALGAQFSGEGPVGLRNILLARGARNVVASLWPVEDVTSSALVAETYARLKAGSSVAEALTLAQRNYLEKNKDRDIQRWAAWSASVSELVTGQ